MLKVNNLEEYIKFYQRLPGNTNRYFTDYHFMHRYNATSEFIPNDSKILDVGCNTAGMGNNLRKNKNCEDWGIDISSIWKKYIPKEYHYRYRIGPVEKLNKYFKKNSFDVVSASEFLEHVLDVNVVMKEIMKVLKKDGIFVGSVPHDKGRRGYGHYKLDSDVHVREFSEFLLRELLEKYFNEIKIIEYIRHTNDKTPEFYIFKATNKKIL